MKAINDGTKLNIGKTLRFIRKLNGLTQRDFAIKALMDVRTVNAIETGRIKNPSYDRLLDLTTALGMTLRDFFGLVEADLTNRWVLGTQQGEFTISFSRQKCKVVSYVPEGTDFFVGKMIVEGRTKIDSSTLAFPGHVFIQVVLGKIHMHLEDKEEILKEGQTVLFDGRLKYAIHNPLIRAATLSIVTSPSFVEQRAFKKKPTAS